MARHNADGNVTMLRVSELGSRFGPPDSGLEAEVLFRLDANPDTTYGFKLRAGDAGGAQYGMYLLLKEAHVHGRRVFVGYEEHAHAHRCYRVSLGGPL